MNRSNTRQCGECHACCNGWLGATINGHVMKSGTPCFFLDNHQCSIYPNRPKNPCQDYWCAWIQDDSIPDWVKPNSSNVIISLKKHPADDTLVYYEVTAAGNEIPPAILTWLIEWSSQQNKNIVYRNGGELYIYGSSTYYAMFNQLVSWGLYLPANILEIN
jgi:hypothetical protein